MWLMSHYEYSFFSLHFLTLSFWLQYVTTYLNLASLYLRAIKDAEVYFKTPNVGEVLVAKVTGNTNPTSITFTPTSEDLINHLKTNQHTFYLKITGGKLAAGTMKIKVNTGFRISVGL